jgi:hypothetical protein
VYEKMHTACSPKFDEDGVKRRIVDWALDVGRSVARCGRQASRCRARLACSSGSPTGSSTRR